MGDYNSKLNQVNEQSYTRGLTQQKIGNIQRKCFE